MQIKKLSLTNFRVFKQADFDFQPGMNLIVGINGVGKSTALDALRIMLSQVLPKFTASRSSRLPFETNDITVGSNALFTNIDFEAQGIDFSYDAYMPREKFSSETRRTISEAEFAYHLSREERIRLRREKLTGYTQLEHYDLQPDEKELPKNIKKQSEQPLAVFFSTRRSVPTGDAPSRAASAGGQAAAFSEALSGRELRWREFAEWWRVQKVLGEESGKSVFGRNMEVLSNTISLFLDDVHDLRATDNSPPTLLLNKGDTILDVRQLSDGERGLLSLVLDLARRLAQANPKLPDPISTGKGVVLIDELDLHLHPGWQRDVISKLTKTFPECQFIATTHSPQILGEVAPESIIILEAGKEPYRPDQSLGMDTNWILRFLMDTDERNSEAKQELEQIANLIEDDEYEQAAAMIDTARQKYGETAELVRLQTRIDRIRLLGE